ncbi:MAG TPA: superoxide dismutase family protein [Candidatus Eisenbergiella merdipullorum]|uniref:Superoxide dismutase family protein n=1 Tax=Candidatus Eisenbergiella merdipullorum TaxID=2838553 RepID=A0A9D2I8G7_9FIRM|nr:superoxide dismutase family protein [Candidatus Eisenbergiella merdipullorum]
MLKFLTVQPSACADMRGSEKYPDIRGLVTFYAFQNGTVVLADICGLPQAEGECAAGFFGFHIHEGASCSGNDTDPFADAGGHYNPASCPHPAHAGDMPVLEASGGKAWMAFYTERFRPEELLGKTVIIHSLPDDFRSQPAGNAGEKMACGMIV